VRRGQTPLNAAFRNPTVIGALAVLITVLAVFLAYNANNGLPFVQSYRLTAQVPDAAALVPGNEVRIGGVRVGVVESIEPVTEDDGTFAAFPVASRVVSPFVVSAAPPSSAVSSSGVVESVAAPGSTI
jgi:ABC-type transporter Mla subunit MlaD